MCKEQPEWVGWAMMILFLTFEFIRQLFPDIPEVLRELSGHHIMSWVRPLPKSYVELLGPQNVTVYGEEGL